jgi:hypothetical protein
MIFSENEREDVDDIRLRMLRRMNVFMFMVEKEVGLK